jgi:hypothetical protein
MLASWASSKAAPMRAGGWVLLALSPSHGLFDIVSFCKGEGAIPATAVAS